MSYPSQAMAAAFPQICVCNGVEVVEIHQSVRTAVDHCERNRAVFHDQTLIHSFTGTRCLEEPRAKASIGARNGIPETWLGRFTENAFNKSVDVCLRQLLLARSTAMR
jgi:hypothetical protein